MLLQHIMHKLFCKINIRCALHINTTESLDVIQLGCMQYRVSFESCLRQGPIYIPPAVLRYQISMSARFDRYSFIRLHPLLHFHLGHMFFFQAALIIHSKLHSFISILHIASIHFIHFIQCSLSILVHFTVHQIIHSF